MKKQKVVAAAKTDPAPIYDGYLDYNFDRHAGNVTVRSLNIAVFNETIARFKQFDPLVNKIAFFVHGFGDGHGDVPILMWQPPKSDDRSVQD